MEKDFEYNSYTSLKETSRQTCEICDLEFNDRYSCIVHNASHIIIPLLNDLVLCDICNSYVTPDEFNAHTSRHRTIKQEPDEQIKVPEIKLENLPNDETIGVKQEVIEMDSALSEDEFVGDDIKIDSGDDGNEKYDTVIPSIRTKLVFEDDCEFESPKELTECKVDKDTGWSYFNNSVLNNRGNKKCGIMFEEPIDEFECDDYIIPDAPFVSDEDDNYQSVHYNELKSAAVTICRYCKLTFQNRYNLVLHETQHMRWRRSGPRFLLCSYCDRYIAGNYHNLDKHLADKHDNSPRKKCGLSKCIKCHLPYRSYVRHVTNYHQNICGNCLKKFDESILKTHCKECVVTDDLIKVCDVCYACIRKDNNKHIFMGSTSDANKQSCHRCKNSFIELKTIKKIRNAKRERKDQKKRLTNEERLKNICHRLKMINKLSKFYDDVLFKKLTFDSCESRPISVLFELVIYKYKQLFFKDLIITQADIIFGVLNLISVLS